MESIRRVNAPRPPAATPAPWTELGCREIGGPPGTRAGGVAIRPEPDGLWSVRWRGAEDHESVLGPDHLDSLAERLVEEHGLGRGDLLAMFASCGIGTVQEFALRNMP